MAVDMGSIGALVSSMKTAAEIVKSAIGIRDAAMLQSKVIELNGVVLSAQSSALAAQLDQFALLDRVRELEEKIAHMKAWDTEKQRYELKEVGPSTFAYAPKPGMDSAEPKHLLCTACYQHGKKSILQFKTVSGFGSSGSQSFKCPECGLTIFVNRDFFTGP